MKNSLPDKFREAVEHICSKHSVILLEAVVRGSNQKTIVELYVDAEVHVSLEVCVQITKEILAQSETDEFVANLQRLEVSSPGVDRALQHSWQYNKHISRSLTVELLDNTSVTGRLEEVSSSGIRISKLPKGRSKKETPQNVEIPYSSIKQSVVQLTWK